MTCNFCLFSDSSKNFVKLARRKVSFDMFEKRRTFLRLFNFERELKSLMKLRDARAVFDRPGGHSHGALTLSTTFGAGGGA
jgi:glutaredoxin-related protein